MNSIGAAATGGDVSELERYMAWLRDRRGLEFGDYRSLHRWSVEDLAGFWSSIWEFAGVQAARSYDTVLTQEEMPGAAWFVGAKVNYAEHAVRYAAVEPHAPAVIGFSQTRDRVELTWADLADQVARARAGLRRLGVGPGDRVAAYLPNIPETVVAFLAAASLGAVWAACAPEFGVRSVVDRFQQIEPSVLITVSGYRYGVKDIDRQSEVVQVRAALPGLRHVVHVPYGCFDDLDAALSWHELLAQPGDAAFDPLSFDHPLCILFSSGTTGVPKAITHGHGGILLEHLKNHMLSWDIRPGDRVLWYTTSAWMMWNALVSGLLTGATIVTIDGNPSWPDLQWQWRLAEEIRATLMGASPPFLMACRKEGLTPAADHDLSELRQIGAAGSPLPAEGHHWVAEQFGPGVLLNVGSGGTDICSAIVQGSPPQSVVPGEISGPCLGVAATAFDEHGREVVGRPGELVITKPMPSMPIAFWDDLPVTDSASRYRQTYFETFPGVWRHGDWVRFSETGSCVVTGRSDATLNRGGVRLGTAELYRVIEEMPEIDDSLVVHLEDGAGGPGELILFVAIRAGAVLDDHLRGGIVTEVRGALSPRYVPDRILEVPGVPRNRSGKKLEVPVKRLLQGAPAADVAALDSLADPTALDVFIGLADVRGRAVADSFASTLELVLPRENK